MASELGNAAVVYVLYTGQSHQPVGVFSSKERAARFLIDNALWGNVARYELDMALMDFVMARVDIGTSKDRNNPSDVAAFSSALPLVLQASIRDGRGEIVDRETGDTYSFSDYAALLT
ncbi:DUF7710 domain-containing protein [Aliiroseovarius sp.]|uniref:DUF7710 domain-containing protein n=1 Tax=Aliiroseovarius sp. TaxID=1872442 RepID=UPI003BA84886